MPIKDPSLYPKNWKEIRAEIIERSGNICECVGFCGQKHLCMEVNGRGALHFNGTVVLTIAHLCFDPPCEDRKHLKALCQLCHNRYDTSHRVRHAKETRRLNALRI